MERGRMDKNFNELYSKRAIHIEDKRQGDSGFLLLAFFEGFEQDRQSLC